MKSIFISTFTRQLEFWTLHGILNALPSFVIALVFLGLWRSPSAVSAMLLAIAIYILAFASITSLPGPLSEENHLFARSIRLGAKIRIGIGFLSVPFIFGNLVMLTPDCWLGFLAIALQNQVARVLGTDVQSAVISRIGSTSDIHGEGASARFLPVFTTTMLEGFIISFMLLTISFFCVMFLQSRERKKLFKGAPDA